MKLEDAETSVTKGGLTAKPFLDSIHMLCMSHVIRALTAKSFLDICLT